jgi:septal ring factor EnvC (AmiA/AmiB activator)
MWNTAEGLARLFYASQWVIALFGGLTALAIVFSIVVSIRKDRIVAQNEAEIAARTEATINDQSTRISSLTEELNVAKKNLKEVTSQRTLSVDQNAKIIAYLKKSGPQETVIIRVDDLEAQTFAEEITQTLSDAKWTVKPAPFRIITPR